MNEQGPADSMLYLLVGVPLLAILLIGYFADSNHLSEDSGHRVGGAEISQRTPLENAAGIRAAVRETPGEPGNL